MLLRSSEPLCICSGRISCGLEESAMRWRGYNYKRQRPWIPDQVRDDRRGEEALAGFRPRTTWGRNTCGVAAPHDAGELCGVSAPHAEVLLFRQKDPKPGAPGRGPSGAFAPVPKVRAAELASLKQSSPPNRVRDRGAATPAGARRWRHGMARGIHAKNPGSSITNVEDCKCSVIPFDRLRTGVDRMRGCPQEGNQERRAVVFLPFPSFSSPL